MRWQPIPLNIRLLATLAVWSAFGCGTDDPQLVDAFPVSEPIPESDSFALGEESKAPPLLLFQEDFDWTLGLERLRFRDVVQFDIEQGQLTSHGGQSKAISRAFLAQRRAGAISIEWQARFAKGASGEFRLVLGASDDKPLYELVTEPKLEGRGGPAFRLTLYRHQDGERVELGSSRIPVKDGRRRTGFHFRWDLSPKGDIDVSIDDGAAHPENGLHSWDATYDRWWNLQLTSHTTGLFSLDDLKVTARRAKFLVVVARELAEQRKVLHALQRYRSDAREAGWDSSLLVVDRANEPQEQVLELKERIIAAYQRGASGLVIVGSSDAIPPVSWHVHPQEPFTFPSDLIYADVDAWVDLDQDTVFENFDSRMADDGSWVPDESRPANPQSPRYIPELFFARIAARPVSASLTEEADYVVRYLERVAAYRRDGTRLTPEQDNRSFVLSEDEWQGKDLAHILTSVTPNVLGLYNRGVTNAPRYAEALEDGYRFVTLIAHSDAYGHYLTAWDGQQQTSSSFTIPWLRRLTPKVSQLNLIACSSCNFTMLNMGAVYLFENDYLLNVLGSTGAWAIGPDVSYYQDLAAGTSVGTALRDLARRNDHDEGWPKGILLGDPLLLYTKDVPNMAPSLTTSLYSVQVRVGETLSLQLDTEDPEGDSVKVSVGGLPAGAYFDGKILYFSPTDEQSGLFFETYVELTQPGAASVYREPFVIEVKSALPTPDGLNNGDFEQGLDGIPRGWSTEAWDPGGSDFLWSGEIGRDGSAGVAIISSSPNDSRWLQPVYGLTPGARYTLSGWLKGEQIEGEQTDASVSLGVFESGDHVGQGGTFDWTRFELTFTAPETGTITVACRLGFFGDLTTGKGYCDQIALTLAPPP